MIAGLISSKGAARQIMTAGEVKLIELLISSDVLEEADRNISERFPQLVGDYRAFLRQIAPTLVEDPTLQEVKAAIPWVGKDDAPILAAALKDNADFLVTWNTLDFMSPKVPKNLPIKIMNPGAFIDHWSDSFR